MCWLLSIKKSTSLSPKSLSWLKNTSFWRGKSNCCNYLRTKFLKPKIVGYFVWLIFSILVRNIGNTFMKFSVQMLLIRNKRKYLPLSHIQLKLVYFQRAVSILWYLLSNYWHHDHFINPAQSQFSSKFTIFVIVEKPEDSSQPPAARH